MAWVGRGYVGGVVCEGHVHPGVGVGREVRPVHAGVEGGEILAAGVLEKGLKNYFLNFL